MNNQSSQNYLNRFSRAYVSQNSFKDDSTGKTIEYERFVLEYFVKDKPMTIEIPIKKDSPVTQKDIMLLDIADDLSKPPFQAPQE